MHVKTTINLMVLFLFAGGSKRPSARFFNICSNRMTVWGTRYNCECVIYDSLSGELLPGNYTAINKLEPTDNEVWYNESLQVEYEVCIFSMPKGKNCSKANLVCMRKRLKFS